MATNKKSNDGEPLAKHPKLGLMKQHADNDGHEDHRPPLTYLELYAGVGGWRMALELAVVSSSTTTITTRCVGALDHSDLCVAVYRHNFVIKNDDKNDHDSVVCPRTTNIETLTNQDLTTTRLYQANIWFMSPPCQPHTRQHTNQANDAEDVRSQSFWHLCQLLRKMPFDALPRLLCLENVVQFEKSTSCQEWRRTLHQAGYVWSEFHLNPTQVGLPNDRPRYFCVAVLLLPEQNRNKEGNNPLLEEYFTVTTDEPFDASKFTIHTSVPQVGILASDDKRLAETMPCISEFLDPPDDQSKEAQLIVPEKVLKRNAAWCFDIVTPQSTRSACFTSSYGKFVRGTGSILYTGNKDCLPFLSLQDPDQRQFDQNSWLDRLANKHQDLRYFSGLEMARLFGFASKFTFPPDVTLKQQWKLVGNSINCRLASKLIRLGLDVASYWNDVT